jgi:hypothetical protein
MSAIGGNADVILCIASIAFWSLMTQSGHGRADFAATHNNFFRLVSSSSSTLGGSCGGVRSREQKHLE